MLGASAQDGRREQKMCFYAFAMGRKRLRMSHVQVGCGQAEPQTWSTSECGKCWHEIGDWLYDWWWRNLVLATTRCAPSSEKIWVSGRSVPGLWWRYGRCQELLQKMPHDKRDYGLSRYPGNEQLDIKYIFFIRENKIDTYEYKQCIKIGCLQWQDDTN